MVAILQLGNLGVVKVGTGPEVTQFGSGGARAEAQAAQRESLHGDGCPGPGQGCASTRRMGHRPSWHRSTEAWQTHASQLCGSRMNGTIPELGSSWPRRACAKPTPLTSARAQSLFHNVPSRGKSEEMTSAGMLTLLG